VRDEVGFTLRAHQVSQPLDSSVICDMAAVGFGWARAFGLQDGDKPYGTWDDDRVRWIEAENGGGVTPAWMGYMMF
jgi:hypothetical protein